ncbi:hypothetical protein PFISCL1PPCAC_17242, partial [Pristionchus fissidentatus]
VDNCQLEGTGIFDQNFIENFANLSGSSCPILNVESDQESIEKGRYYPSKEIVKSLCRLKTINLLSMTLHSDWIYELLSLRLMLKEEGNFRFSVTENLKLEQFRPLMNSE